MSAFELERRVPQDWWDHPNVVARSLRSITPPAPLDVAEREFTAAQLAEAEMTGERA